MSCSDSGVAGHISSFFRRSTPRPPGGTSAIMMHAFFSAYRPHVGHRSSFKRYRRRSKAKVAPCDMNRLRA